MIATYGKVYVAQIAFGANLAQTVRAITEAEAYNGPALIVAYSVCIAHGIDMSRGIEQQKNAVASGYWPLYRYNPSARGPGKARWFWTAKTRPFPLKNMPIMKIATGH